MAKRKTSKSVEKLTEVVQLTDDEKLIIEGMISRGCPKDEIFKKIGKDKELVNAYRNSILPPKVKSKKVTGLDKFMKGKNEGQFAVMTPSAAESSDDFLKNHYNRPKVDNSDKIHKIRGEDN